MKQLARIAILALAPLAMSAVPGPTIIAHPKSEGEALIIPAESSLKFAGWDKYGYAKFKGSFIVTGTFTYGCAVDCEGPVEDAYIRLDLVPDKAIAARLPHWKLRDNDRMLVISHERNLAHVIATRKQYADIRSGRIQYLQGRVSIVVDDFRTGIECDSANFQARFVSIVQAPKVERIELNGEYGCA